MSITRIATLTVASLLLVTSCSLQDPNSLCAELRSDAIQFNSSRFLANFGNDVVEGVDPLSERPASPVPDPALLEAYSAFSAALQAAIPSNFDPLNQGTPRVDRLVAGLALDTQVLASPDTYSDAAAAAEYQRGFETYLEEFWTLCEYDKGAPES